MPSAGSFAASQRLTRYAIDIVFVVDATCPMGSFIDMLQSEAYHLCMQICEEMEEHGHDVDEIRARVITFRDFAADQEALISSPFFQFPNEKIEFQSFLDGIQAYGGGDEPENGLEALAEAMNSEWTDKGTKRKHIILLFTDGSTIRLEDSAKDHPQYPVNAPANLTDLQDWWEFGTPNGCLEQAAKRLYIFAPDVYAWNVIGLWNRTWLIPVSQGDGCCELTFDDLTKAFGL